jgi:hypothetical protein
MCGFCPCCIPSVIDEHVKEALHGSIIIAVAFAAHRRPEAGRLHHLAILRRGVLNARIGMVDQAGAGPPTRTALLDDDTA